jgi:hypothetical protein
MPAARASAQPVHPIDSVRATSRTHAGPFYITPGLLIREIGVDGNVFNEPEDPKSDFMFTVVPKADVAVPIARRAMLKIASAVDLVYYQTYSSERSVNPLFVPRGELYLNKVTLFAEGSYLRTRQRPSYEIDTRSLRTERWLSAGVGYAYSPKLSFEVIGRRFATDYDSDEVFLEVPLQETLNRDSTGGAASIKYALTPKTTLVLRGDTTQDRFEFSPSRNADTVRIMPGVEFDTRALIFGSGYVGVRSFQTLSEDLEDFQGIVAAAALGYTLLGRTIIVFAADRDVTYSFERYQPYFVVDSYGVTVRHQLVGRFDVMGGAFRHQYTYRDLFVEGAPPPTGTPRVDVTRNLTLSLGYNLGPDVRLALGASYWQRESTVEQYRDYDAMRIGFSLNYGF